MVEDVIISVCGKAEVISKFYPPSVLPFPEDIEREIKKCLRKVYFVSLKV
jgi:2-oxoglutarate ferredoxin oxidoreductase subunit alpha